MGHPTCLVCDVRIESYDGTELCPGCEENAE
jgi:hypothetical protein